MTARVGNQLISIQPDELKFILDEFKNQSYCDLEVANKTGHYVAFKVKTTFPRRYCVGPNRGLIQPWDSCIVRVTSALRECPRNMECKDKFLIQSVIVPPHTDVENLPQNTFNRENGKRIEECKLKVSYISAPSPQSSLESVVSNGDGLSSKEERDTATSKTQQLQRELDMLKRQITERNDQGFDFKIQALLGLIIIFSTFIVFSYIR